MYVVGMVLLGLGIPLLFLSVISLFIGAPVIWGLICTAFVPVPMIVGGIALIRRVEDREALGQGGGEDVPQPEPQGMDRPIRRDMSYVMDFNLTRLNWIGWLLLLGTFGFFGAEVASLAWAVGPGQDPRLLRVFGLPGLFLTVGFFVGLKWLLGLFGVSIYRHADHRGNPRA